MFSLRLKELRQKNNLSQKEFAEILKVSTGTVGNWEVGLREPDFKMLMKIADIFNVSCDYILDRYSNEEDPEKNLIRISVSPIENEMLSEFRNVGKKLGPDGQRALISIANILHNKIQ
ncbi:MAG: helix-turn-helix domain-containing protein [Clostridia bacterium]|nr:helix-turn-helix domain-containing protein [Clostridia bacterium]